MAQRLIICFDPERLVTLPCPALYPELGRELLLLSGTPSEGDWARCATALAAANSDGVPVKLRLLVARADRKASVTSAQEAWVKAPEVVARRLQALLPALQLEWQHGEVAVSPVAQAPVVVICTRFERPAPADQSALAQRYLLPLALRFFLDSDVLLRGQFSSARELKQLIVTATGPDLMAATRDWARSLVRSKELLVRSRDRQMDAQCRVALYDDDVSALLTTVFRAPAIDKLTLGWFHHLQEEDRRIAAWFSTSRWDKKIGNGISDLVSSQAKPNIMP